MNKQQLIEKGEDLVAKHLGGTWRFQADTRSIKRFGQCRYSRKTIVISTKLAEFATDHEVLDTILHEIAHALTPGHGHDQVWARKARELGADGNACYSGKTKPAAIRAHAVYAKYIGTCPNGHTVYKTRRPTREASCGKCSNKFDDRYIITYRENKPPIK